MYARRYAARKKPSRYRRSYRRKAPATTRRYASTYRRTRRTYARKPMTKRRILDVASTKKQDTMLVYTNVTAAAPSSTTYAQQAAVLVGSNGIYKFLWCATARDVTRTSGGGASNGGNVFDQSTRTASTCYMRGLREAVRISTSSAAPWEWRRICFRYRGPELVNDNASPGATYAETINGYSRAVSIYQTVQGTLEQELFRGTYQSDYLDVMTAKTDPLQMDIMYDKVRTIHSGNANGVIREYKMWHEMNKNLVYADDENGGHEVSNVLSVRSKAGMGDYYVYDIFRCISGAAVTDQLSFAPQATLYWHEK